MANPLKDWTHGKKTEAEPRQVLPLQRAPEWVEEAKLWRALLSKKLGGLATPFPDLKGKFFHWAGTLYEVMTQEKITDQKLLRVLHRPYSLEETRVFYWVMMDDVDPRLALSIGMRK